MILKNKIKTIPWNQFFEIEEKDNSIQVNSSYIIIKIIKIINYGERYMVFYNNPLERLKRNGLNSAIVLKKEYGFDITFKSKEKGNR